MNLSNYLKEITKELRLTTFPTQNAVINFTVFVVGFTAVMAVFLGVLDLGFGKGTLSGIEIFKTSDFVTNLKPVAEVINAATSTATTTVN